MDWQSMKPEQKRDAQRILEKLRQAGVQTSVSQVAKYFAVATEWDNGLINLATLCDRTGWTPPNPTVERESVHTAQLMTSALRHVRKVLVADGSPESLEALEQLPAAEPH